MITAKLFSEALQLVLALYIFKLLFYFKSVIISNQVKYYLAANRGNFLEIQYSMAFKGVLCRFSYDSLLLKEHVPMLMMPRT